MRLIKIEQISKEVVVLKWEDGREYACFVKKLRARCPCAVCRQKRENKNPLKVFDSEPADLELTGWHWVGRYALALHWSDRHDTGIYTYEYLRKVCEEEGHG
jgi:DUF971 family protein